MKKNMVVFFLLIICMVISLTITGFIFDYYSTLQLYFLKIGLFVIVSISIVFILLVVFKYRNIDRSNYNKKISFFVAFITFVVSFIICSSLSTFTVDKWQNNKGSKLLMTANFVKVQNLIDHEKTVFDKNELTAYSREQIREMFNYDEEVNNNSVITILNYEDTETKSEADVYYAFTVGAKDYYIVLIYSGKIDSCELLNAECFPEGTVLKLGVGGYGLY